MLAALNRWLALGRVQLAQDAASGFGEHFVVDGGGEAAALFTIAHTAAAFLSGADLSRLHRCDNPRCILYFVDTTKSATRRWCSNGCMNRARSAQRYAALRAHESGG